MAFPHCDSTRLNSFCAGRCGQQHHNTAGGCASPLPPPPSAPLSTPAPPSDAPVLEWSRRRRAGQALTALRTAAAAAARRSRLLCCGVVVRTCRHGTEGDGPGAVPSLCAGTPSISSNQYCAISLHSTRKLTMLLILQMFVSCLGPLAENINQGGVELRSHHHRVPWPA